MTQALKLQTYKNHMANDFNMYKERLHVCIYIVCTYHFQNFAFSKDSTLETVFKKLLEILEIPRGRNMKTE